MRKPKETLYETYQDYQIFENEYETNLEEDNENYVGSLVKLGIKIIVGIIVGSCISPNDIVGIYLCVGLLAGIPFFNKIVHFNLFGNSILVFAFWFIKVILSATIGMFAVPIMAVWYIVNIIEQKQRKWRNR